MGRAAGAPTGTCGALWCANLSLGTNTDGTVYGYTSAGERSIKGALAPDSFTVDGVTYTVEQLYYAPSGFDLDLVLDRALPKGTYTLALNGVKFGITVDDTSTAHLELRGVTSSLPKRFGDVVAVNLREPTTGTVELLVSPQTVSEGKPSSPGDTSVTWTVRATTDRDIRPEADLDFAMSLSSDGMSASSADGDYVLLNETVRFQGSETWTRSEIDGDNRYVLEKSGTVTIIDDAIVEGPETFVIILQRTPGDVLFTIKGVGGEQREEVSIEDEDTFGIGVTVSKDVVPLGETTDVTVTFEILDGEGHAQAEDGCVLASALADVSTTVAGTASTSDYSYTVQSGSVTDVDFGACETTQEAVLAITVPETAVKGRTITFMPALASSHIAHGDFDTTLHDGATIAIEGAVPPAVTGVEVEPGNRSLEVSWTAVTDATGYVVEWKSGAQDWASNRSRDVSGGTSTSDTITGLTNDVEYTVRVRAENDEGVGPASNEIKGTPTDGTRLATLTIDAGALSPAFDPSEDQYTATVAVETLTVTATPVDPNSTVTVGSGTDSDPDKDGFQVPLALGANTVQIVVDPADSGTPDRTYTLRITRVAAPTIEIKASHTMLPLAWTDPDGKLEFELTRTGDAMDELEVTLNLGQDHAWLSTQHRRHDVTFREKSLTVQGKSVPSA